MRPWCQVCGTRNHLNQSKHPAATRGLPPPVHRLRKKSGSSSGAEGRFFCGAVRGRPKNNHAKEPTNGRQITAASHSHRGMTRTLYWPDIAMSTTQKIINMTTMTRITTRGIQPFYAEGLRNHVHAVPRRGVYSAGVRRITMATPGNAWSAVDAALSGGLPVAVVAADDPTALSTLQPDVAITESDVGALALTSGSTGAPKAVVLSRSALQAASELLHARLGGPGVWTCVLPPTYVAGLMTLVRTWYAGGEPIVGRPDLADITPSPGRSYVSVVATQLHRALMDPDIVARLRDFSAVVVGGSAIPRDLVARARDEGIRVVTSYGMSETCGGCVYDGQPLDGIELGTRADGRLWIEGPTLFSGYRLRPDLTAACLVDGRFATSDRGTIATDGSLTVTGRSDDVVITGGMNVDLAEVQRLLDAASHVPIAVLAIPDPEWGTRIVAATTGSVDLAAIHAMLPGEPAARPRDVRRVEAFPLTASGKLDRQALRREWDG